jgi:hypothetical protein
LTAASRRICLWASAVSLIAGLGPGSAAAADQLSIKITKTDVNLGARTVIRGQLSTSGTKKGQRVVLLGRSFPYKRGRVVASTTTGTSGAYSFRVRPSLNTRYRVKFKTVFSKRVRVYVYPVQTNTRVRTISGNRARVHFFVKFPANYPLRLSGRRLTWYFRKSGRPVFRKIKTTRTRATEANRVFGDAIINLPESRRGYDYFITWCFAIGRKGEDIGVTRQSGGACPRRFRITSA